MARIPHAGPIVLLILDGWGIARPNVGNAVTLGHTPNFVRLWRASGCPQLHASGRAVGLPSGQDGNSEAGHMNIGAGRIVEQDAVAISKSINDGSFFKNPALVGAIHHAKKHQGTLHLMGMLTTYQSGHAYPDHVLALLTLAHIHKVRRVRVHLFTDGRDSSPYDALGLLDTLERSLKPHQAIATIMGRFWAMDRKKVWERTKEAYDALTAGHGAKFARAREAILAAYSTGKSDEFIPPSVVMHGSAPVGHIKSNDAIVFWNLRSDRARQITKAFVQSDFEARGGFKRAHVLRNTFFAAMTNFGPDLEGVHTAFHSHDIPETLPVALRGLRQLYVAETEKFAHVTYFFNGGHDHAIAGEERLLVPSPNVTSYDQKPEMSTYEIAHAIVEGVKHGKFDLIVANFACPDMIGHTGNLEAGITAVGHADKCLGLVEVAVRHAHGTLMVSADHGNVEEMINLKTGAIDTEHSTNPVPFILTTAARARPRIKLKGALQDIAPTILTLVGRTKPAVMTGKSLLGR